MIDLFLERSFTSLHKEGEDLCGDYVTMVQTPERLTAVLSDGLGSGVKANILATLTGKILCTMMSGNMSMEDSVTTALATLPVCSQRHLAYSTFTLLQLDQLTGMAYLAEYDNPLAILLRRGRLVEPGRSRRVISGKEIAESRLRLGPDDMLILLSDGVTAAGMDGVIPGGWKREGVIDLAQTFYSPTVSAKAMSSAICEACSDLYLGHLKDDCTVAVFRMRRRNVVSMMIGPPSNAQEDDRILRLFFAKEGKKIVSGGTTARLVSKFLNRPLVSRGVYFDPEVPATAEIEGVDLVTEGVVTLGKVVELARQYTDPQSVTPNLEGKRDGASQIARLLFDEATDINLLVGQAVNPAHQNQESPISMSIKIDEVSELKCHLEDMGKNVKLSYC